MKTETPTPTAEEPTPMAKLWAFLKKHAVQTEDEKEIQGGFADLTFFKVYAKDNPSAEELRELVTKAYFGDFADVNLFDGKEHNYLELGGWIGDQGCALALMGLGKILGLWDLLCPAMLNLPPDLAKQMAGQGMISIIAKRTTEEIAADERRKKEAEDLKNGALAKLSPEEKAILGLSSK